MTNRKLSSLRILYCAKGDRAKACLAALRRASANIVSVVVSAADQIPAVASDLPICHVGDINAPETLEQIRYLRPDLIILAGFTQIVRAEFLALAPKGVINLHGGKLPNYRGGSPINWQIINGETEGGCAIHYVDEGIDTGDIICQETYAIGPNETAGDAMTKTLEIFPRLLLQVIDQIRRGSVERHKQNLVSGAHFKKRHPKDGRVSWSAMSATEVHNMVRALNGPSLPGAFCFLDGRKIVLWESAQISEVVIGSPGQVVAKRKQGIVIAARDQALEIRTLWNTERQHPENAIQSLSKGQILM